MKTTPIVGFYFARCAWPRGYIASIPADDGTIDLRLHCPGGDVDEGWAIVDKLRATGKTISATIEGQCASMATVILLAASVRKGAKHATMLIHEPYYPEYTLASAYHADDLDKLAADLRSNTAKIVDFYVERTGANREELVELMSKEEFISMERAKELGFIQEIIEPKSASVQSKRSNATAWIKHQLNKQITMTKKQKNDEGKSSLAKAFATIATALGIESPKPVNYELNTASGETLTIDKPEGEDPAVGDTASPDGEHQMPDGKVIIVKDGVITEIRDTEDDGEGDGESAEDKCKKKDERIAELEAKVEELTKNAKSDSDKRILNAVAIAGGESWLREAKSNYKPAARQITPQPKKDAVPAAKQSLVAKKLAEIQRRNEETAD